MQISFTTDPIKLRNKSITYWLAAIITILSFAHCSRPKEVLGRKPMEQLMYDIYIAEAMIDNDYSSFRTAEQKEALINEVFGKHNTTQAQWDTSLSWYSDRVDIYLKMNDSVRARLRRDRDAMNDLLSAQNAVLQSVKDRSLMTSDVPHHYSFSELNPKGGFRFKLDSAKVANQLGDSLFMFSFDALMVPPTMSEELTAMLLLQYKDSTIWLRENITENRTYAMSGLKYLPIDTIFTKPEKGDTTETFVAQIDSIVVDTLRTLTGFVHLQDLMGIYKGIQLNHIYLGDATDSVTIATAARAQANSADATRPTGAQPHLLRRSQDEADQLQPTDRAIDHYEMEIEAD